MEKKSDSEDYNRAGLASLHRLKLIEAFVPLKGKEIHEICAGYGETLFHKEKASAKSIVGVDFPSARKGFEALKMITGLQETDNLKYLTRDFLQVDFGNTRFDLIFSFDTFEHFDNPVARYETACKLLRPGGHICFIFGPLFRSPQGAHRYYYTGIPYF